MGEATDKIMAQWGAAGALLIVAGVWIGYLHRELRRAQEARVKDAQKVTQTLLELTKEWQEAIGALTSAIEKLDARLERR